MMKKIFILLLFIASFIACNKDKTSDYDPSRHIKMIVVNKGWGRAETVESAALSVIYDDGGTTFDLFRDVNENRPLGDVTQSIIYINGNYFVAIDNPQKVEVIEPQTFKSVATIKYAEGNGGCPRFIQPISNTEAIISDLRKQLVRINTKTHTVVEYIDIDEIGPVEKMLTVDKKLFCAAPSKGIVVFDTDNIKGSATRLVEGLEGSIVETAKMILDKNNKLWVLTTGSKKVILNCINIETEKVEKTVDVPYVSEGDADYAEDCITGPIWPISRMDTDRKREKLYFYMTILSESNSIGAIFTLNVDTDEVALYRKLPGLGLMNGMGISPNGDVFLCDGLGHTEQRGYVREYKANGNIISQRVGVYPRMIHFTEYDN